MKFPHLLQKLGLICLLCLYASHTTWAQTLYTNNDCENAYYLNGPGTYSGSTNTNITTLDDVRSCGGASSVTGEKMVWFRITGNGRPILAQTIAGVTNFDTQIWVFNDEGYPTYKCELSIMWFGQRLTFFPFNCIAGNHNTSNNLAQVCFPTVSGETYYIIVGGTSSIRGNFQLKVSDINLPTGTDGTRCGTGSVQLRASSPNGGTFRWYTSYRGPGASGGAGSVGTGATYNTPSISSGTYSVYRYYYVSETFPGCASARRQVFARVKPVPATPTTEGVKVCGSERGCIEVTNRLGSLGYTWYTASSGGASVNSGYRYCRSVTSTTTYYVAATNYYNCSSSRRGATFTYIPPPPSPTVQNDTLCAPGQAVLGATGTGNSGTYLRWFYLPSGGAFLPGITDSYMPVISNTRKYYVAEIDADGCASNRTQVTAAVLSPPPPPITISDTLCGPGNVNLAVSGPGATYLWYDAPSAGNSVFQGPIYSPNLSQTQSYWVLATNGPCQGGRTPVEGRIYPKAPPPQTVSDESCGSANLQLLATGMGGQSRWYDADSAGNLLYTGDTLRQFFGSSQNVWVEEISYVTTKLADDFNANINADLWEFTNGTRNDRCGAFDSHALYFETPRGVSRRARTHPIDLRQGGILSFQLKISDGAGSCEELDAGEEVILEYLRDGGNAYIGVDTFYNDGTYSEFAAVSIKIPPGAQQQGVRFQLRQRPFSVSGGDNWIIDDFAIDVTILSECASDRSLAKARIKRIPPLPTGVTRDTLCGPGIARLEATGMGGMIEWYDADSGGTQVSLGSVFQPNLTANTPYWVFQSDTNGCRSARIPTEVIVYPVPDPPFVIGDDICGPNLTNLRTVGSQGIVRWYDMPVGGTLVNTDSIYNPFILNTTTYYVDEEIDGCVGDRQAITATVFPVPTRPASTFVDTLCGPGNARFEVAGSGDLIFWMDSAFSGMKIGEGNEYKTFLSTSTDFWAFEASMRKAEGIPLPPQDTSSKKGAQGFWFVAPTDMVLAGLRVPLMASVSDTQSVSLVRFNTMPTRRNSNFDVLAHYPKVASTGLITDSLPIQAGDIIGVLGVRGGVNSVSNAASFDTLMGVYPVEIQALYSPDDISRTEPLTILTDQSLGLGRVMFFAHPACFSGRRKMAGEIIPIPPAPAVISDSICGPGVANLMAISTMDSTSTLHWFDADSAGIELAQGPAFSPFVDRDTTFWVKEIRRGCSSDLQPVYVVVYTIPEPPVLIPDTFLCDSGYVTYRAIADSGTISWYDTDSAVVAFARGDTLRRFLTKTTTLYATYTDEHCESPKRAIETIVYPSPPPPISAEEVHVCGPDTVVFLAEGAGGVLSWYSQAQGNTSFLTQGDTFSIFLMRDQLFWVGEERNGCTGPRTQVEGIVNIIPDPPVTADAWICDDGDATLFAMADNRFIEWYDADSAGALINTGNAYSTFVTDTTTFWTQIPAAKIDRMGAKDTSIDNGGMSDFFADGLSFDVINPTTIKQVTVYPKDSGKIVVRLVNRFGQPLQTHEELVDGPGPVDLLLAFPLVPGKRYHLDAKGSTVSGLFRNSAGFAFPDSSRDLIITGQANAQDGFYYFFYDWKIGHCISERADVSAISYPKATRSPIPATDPASYIASYECIDSEGWTHYFFDAETPEQEDDLLLFSIWKDGQNIGTVGDGSFRLRVHASDNASGGGGLATPILAPYVSNTDGWFVMNRYWDIVPNPAPSRPVKIRFYYNETDLAEINNALVESGDTIPTTHEELNFFVFEKGSANPDLGHLNIPLVDYYQYRSGEVAENNEWRYDFKPPFHYGELQTLFLNSGGVGKGGNKKGALTTGALALVPIGSHVLLTWEALSGFTGDHFEVERSLDGEVFEEIGEVDFINDSIGIQQYEYTDFFTPEAKIYYRVKFVFVDGASFFTNTESIQFVKAIDTLISVYPNPTRGQVTFEFSNIIGKVAVEIISRDGKVVLLEEWTEREALVQSIQLRRLPPGMYIYRIRFSREILVGKLIKVN